MTKYSSISLEGKVKIIKANLDERYKECFCVIQELLQNADDAAASKVMLVQLDRVSTRHELCNTPGLMVINDGPVEESDIRQIFLIADTNKDASTEKIGKFGLGMKSVFHLCEAFMLFGHQQGTGLGDISEMFCPWDNEQDPEMMPPIPRHWRKTFDPDSAALLQDVTQSLREYFQEFGSNWFAIWIPFRQKGHCNPGGEIISYYPLQEQGRNWFTHGDFRKVADMMPLFKNLRTISFVSGALDDFGTLELKPARNTAFTGKVHNNRWSGKVVSDKGVIGEISYCGWEFAQEPELKRLKDCQDWPHSQRWNEQKGTWEQRPEKLQPHVAFCFCQEALSSSDQGQLKLQECVFLPLSDMQETFDNCALPARATINFHGQYFIDAGRRRYVIDATSENIMKKWNTNMRSRMLLPRVIPCLAESLEGWETDDVRRLLECFGKSRFWEQGKEDMCRVNSFMLVLNADSSKTWTWKQVKSGKPYLLLPQQVNKLIRKKLCQSLGSQFELVQADSPRLTCAGACPWNAEQISCFWDAINSLKDRDRLTEETCRFLEQSLALFKGADQGLAGIKEYLQGISLYSFNRLREPLTNILSHYPRRGLGVAKSNLTEKSLTLWSKMLLEVEHCLPLAFDKKETEESAGSYSDSERQRLLLWVQGQLLRHPDESCRALLRNLVNDVFTGKDLRQTDMADYRVIAIGEQYYTLNELLQRKANMALFRFGGNDSTALDKLKAAVDYDCIMMNNQELFEALKGSIGEIETFSLVRHFDRIMARRPNLKGEGERQELVKEIISKVDSLDVCAVRYVLHGNAERYDDRGEIELPDLHDINDEQLYDIAEDILCFFRHGAEKLTIPSCLLEEIWRKQDVLKIHCLKFDDILQKTRRLSDADKSRLCESEKWRGSGVCWKLLREKRHQEEKECIADLPIWPCIGGSYTKITDNVTYVQEVEIPSCLLPHVVCLKVEDLELVRRELPSVKAWRHLDTVNFGLRQPFSPEIARAMIAAIRCNDGEETLPEALFAYPLFELPSGEWVPYMSVTGKYQQQQAGIFSEEQLTEEARKFLAEFREDMGREPDKVHWARYVADKLRQVDDLGWGRNLPDHLCQEKDFCALFTDESVMPVLALFRELNERMDVREFLCAMRGKVSDKRLGQICTCVSRRYANDRQERFLEYLRHFVQRAQTRKDFSWHDVELPNAYGASRPCNKLVHDLNGVDKRHLVMKDIWQSQRTAEHEEAAETCKINPPNLSVKDYERLTGNVEQLFIEYFEDWPREELKMHLGSFLCLLGTNDGLDRAVKDLGVQLSAEKVQRDVSDDYYHRLNDGHYQVIVDIEKGKSIRAKSLCGTWLDIPLEEMSKLEHLLVDGKTKSCDLREVTADRSKKFLYLNLRKVNLGGNKDKAISLLLNTAKKIVYEYLQDQIMTQVKKIEDQEERENERRALCSVYEQKVQTLFENMETYEQQNVEVTRLVIKEVLPTLLEHLPLPTDSKLKQKLHEWNEVMHRQAQQQQSGYEKSSNEEQKKKAIKDALVQLLEENTQVANEVLTCIRKKIGTAECGYREDSILFELFQNADDAAVERQLLQGKNTLDKSAGSYRFTVEIDAAGMTIRHRGRLINQFKAPGFPAEEGEKHGFPYDLKKMLQQGVSDKNDQKMGRTGKFGLGFKSVYLITDEPLVQSGNLAFVIKSSLLPVYLPQEQRHPCDRDETLFFLPWRQSFSREDIQKLLNRFAMSAECLVHFSRMISEIEICDFGQRKIFTRDDNSNSLCIWQLGENMQLALGKVQNAFARVPKNIPTIWNMTPTQIMQDMGFAVNGNFNVDVGRNQLIMSEDNEKRAHDAARELVKHLEQEYHIDDGMARWQSLWDIFTNGSWNTLGKTPEQEQLLRPLIWGTNEKRLGYGSFIEHHAVMPTRLSGDFGTLTSLDKIRYYTDRVISEHWQDCEDLLRQAYELQPKQVVAHDVAERLKNIYAGIDQHWVKIDVVGMIDILAKSSFCLKPEHINGRNWQKVLEQVDKNWPEMSWKLKFLNRENRYCEAKELLFRNPGEDEAKRADFAPAQALLSEKYDRKAWDFFKKCRQKIWITTETMAVWAKDAETDKARKAVCDYLEHGELASTLRSNLQKILPHEGTWLHQWFEYDDRNPGLRRLFPEKLKSEREWQSRLAYPSFYYDDSLDNPETLVIKAAEWKELEQRMSGAEGEECVRKYNVDLYDQETLPEFPLTLRTDEDRSLWMKLLVIGTSHSLGRTTLKQHVGFVKTCQEKGFWYNFTSKNVTAQLWLDVLDEHIDGNSQEFARWFSLLPKIYLFSKYLDDYVNMFRQCSKLSILEDVRVLRDFRDNPDWQGTTFRMPCLKFALGRVGLHFVLRELYRSQTLRLPGMEPYCFVPSAQNCAMFGSVSDSQEMYTKLKEFGLKDPTFGGQCDVAFTLLGDN